MFDMLSRLLVHERQVIWIVSLPLKSMLLELLLYSFPYEEAQISWFKSGRSPYSLF